MACGGDRRAGRAEFHRLHEDAYTPERLRAADPGGGPMHDVSQRDRGDHELREPAEDDRGFATGDSSDHRFFATGAP
jgi:hypothetical protein